MDWSLFGDYSPYETFKNLFYGTNVGKKWYSDQMTHFDFKTLLPALLQVEDRVSMAHGLESRVPLLDHPVVEFAATIPADVKFKDGRMKHILKNAATTILPQSILNRSDKMGFPTPLTEFAKNEARDYIRDVFSSRAALERGFIDNQAVLDGLEHEPQFGRGLWGFLSIRALAAGVP